MLYRGLVQPARVCSDTDVYKLMKKKSMLASPCPRFNTNFPRLHYNESQSKMKSLQAWAMNVSMCVPGASHR